MPKVSIVIPAYNPGAYLRAALQSIEAQSFQDWEVLVVDDHSSEDLAWVERDFPRVRYLRQPHGGVSVARNRGILNTTGPYLALMDQDDLWRPDKLARQVAVMEAEPDVAVCFCQLEVVGETGEGSAVTEAASGYTIEFDGAAPTHPGVSALHHSLRYFAQRFIVPSTVMMRRACLASSGLLDPLMPFSGDFDLLIKLGSRHRVARLASCDVLYRKHANNFSDQYDVGRREVQALIARYTAYARVTRDQALARDVRGLLQRSSTVYAAQAFDCARRSLQQGDMPATWRHLARACWFNPLFVIRSLRPWLQARWVRRSPAGGGESVGSRQAR